VDVFAANGWDFKTNTLRYDSGLYDAEQKKWIRNPPKGLTNNPTSWELYKIFSDRLIIVTDNSTGLITLSIEYFSPHIAKQWVEMFIEAINDHMRERKLEQAVNNIQYLEIQLQKTGIASMQEIFYQLIEEQIKTKMLAEASPEYAFTSLSLVMVPEQKSTPHRGLIVVLGVMMSLFFSIMGYILIHFSKASTTKQPTQ
jgi:capsule polysaccharide export protein KpsE/RkpR